MFKPEQRNIKKLLTCRKFLQLKLVTDCKNILQTQLAEYYRNYTLFLFNYNFSFSCTVKLSVGHCGVIDVYWHGRVECFTLSDCVTRLCSVSNKGSRNVMMMMMMMMMFEVWGRTTSAAARDATRRRVFTVEAGRRGTHPGEYFVIVDTLELIQVNISSL